MTAIGRHGVLVAMAIAVCCRDGLMLLMMRVFAVGMGVFHTVRVCGRAEEPGSIEDQAHAQQDTHQHGGKGHHGEGEGRYVSGMTVSIPEPASRVPIACEGMEIRDGRSLESASSVFWNRYQAAYSLCTLRKYE